VLEICEECVGKQNGDPRIAKDWRLI
jgi:hypothetical protein